MLIVAVTNPASGTCQNLKGPQVQLLHKNPKKRFTVMIVNGEPSVRPKKSLTADNKLPLGRLTDPEPDGIEEIQVSGSTCRLNAGSEVWIWQD
ncbi:hypothetical protein BH24ACI5_BH24ACI5_22010 [soil metagenome]